MRELLRELRKEIQRLKKQTELARTRQILREAKTKLILPTVQVEDKIEGIMEKVKDEEIPDEVLVELRGVVEDMLDILQTYSNELRADIHWLAAQGDKFKRTENIYQWVEWAPAYKIAQAVRNIMSSLSKQMHRIKRITAGRSLFGDVERIETILTMERNTKDLALRVSAAVDEYLRGNFGTAERLIQGEHMIDKPYEVQEDEEKKGEGAIATTLGQAYMNAVYGGKRKRER